MRDNQRHGPARPRHLDEARAGRPRPEGDLPARRRRRGGRAGGRRRRHRRRLDAADRHGAGRRRRVAVPVRAAQGRGPRADDRRGDGRAGRRRHHRRLARRPAPLRPPPARGLAAPSLAARAGGGPADPRPVQPALDRADPGRVRRHQPRHRRHAAGARHAVLVRARARAGGAGRAGGDPPLRAQQRRVDDAAGRVRPGDHEQRRVPALHPRDDRGRDPARGRPAAAGLRSRLDRVLTGLSATIPEDVPDKQP